MKYKGLILDIDNTLYDYNISNNIAKKSVVDFCENKFNIDSVSITKAYDQARKKVHIELSETAASHNRLLYFQKTCEILKLNPLENSLQIYNIYWDTFLENITPFGGVYELLEKYQEYDFNVKRLPIMDQLVSSHQEMKELIDYLDERLQKNEKIVLHCVGGLGRSGLVAASYLKYKGRNAEDAISSVRKVRGVRAVESKIQEEFVENINFN